MCILHSPLGRSYLKVNLPSLQLKEYNIILSALIKFMKYMNFRQSRILKSEKMSCDLIFHKCKRVLYSQWSYFVYLNITKHGVKPPPFWPVRRVANLFGNKNAILSTKVVHNHIVMNSKKSICWRVLALLAHKVLTFDTEKDVKVKC